MLTRTADPDEWLLSIAEARAHVYAVDDEDLYLEGLVAAAHDQVETATRRAFGAAAWRAVLPCFPPTGHPIELVLHPVTAITGLAYTDGDGQAQTLAEGVDFRSNLAGAPALLFAENGWPSTQTGSAVVVDLTAGEANPPARAKHAARLLVGHWYLNREQVGPGSLKSLPHAFTALCGGLKWGGYS